MCFGSSGYNKCERWDGMSFQKEKIQISFTMILDYQIIKERFFFEKIYFEHI